MCPIRQIALARGLHTFTSTLGPNTGHTSYKYTSVQVQRAQVWVDEPVELFFNLSFIYILYILNKLLHFCEVQFNRDW